LAIQKPIRQLTTQLLRFARGPTIHITLSDILYDVSMKEADTMAESQKHPNRYYLIIALLVCAGSNGCGGNGFAKVEGMVSLDGKALEGGSVAFYPVQSGPLSYSDIGSNGSYQIRTASRQGVLPGQYVATVSWRSRSPSPGMSLREILALEKVPIRYCTRQTSDLRIEVEPGSNSIDLKLTTKK
jgi:hypothetical protein